MRRALGQSIIILSLAAILTLASYALRPGALPVRTGEFEISLEAARALPEALWVDARTEDAFERSHSDGAILLNQEDWEGGLVRLLEAWRPGATIVVYCSSQACLRSHEVAERLRAELGHEEVYSLRGGWEAMQEAGMVGGSSE